MSIKNALFVGLFGAVALFGVGCGGNACEDAAEKISAKLKECNPDATTDEGDEEGEEVECTDERAAAAEKAAECAEKDSCDDFTACLIGG